MIFSARGCALLLAAALLLSVLTGAASASVSAKDFRGKTITLQKPARRIVCLIESGLSGLYMLGAGEQVVGVSANVYATGVNRWYAALDQRLREKQLPAPGNWDFVSLESVLALRPDLVLIWSEQTETIAALEARGIPVFGVSLKSIDDVYQEIEELGRLTGREARAAEIIAWTKGELARFTARIPTDVNRPGLYYMWTQGDLETSCGGSTVNDLISMAGGRNVCGQLHKEHTTLSREHLLRWNPEVLVMWYNERKSPKDILADPQWKNVAAVQQGRVHEFPEVFLCDLWTLKFVHAVKMVAKWTHPSLFADIDLGKEQEEMLLRLYGKKLSRL